MDGMVEQKQSVTFGYGAISQTIEEQANEQGFTLGDKAEFIQGLVKARTMLMFHVFTDSQTRAVTQKIHKIVMKNLKPLT